MLITPVEHSPPVRAPCAPQCLEMLEIRFLIGEMTWEQREESKTCEIIQNLAFFLKHDACALPEYVANATSQLLKPQVALSTLSFPLSEH